MGYDPTKTGASRTLSIGEHRFRIVDTEEHVSKNGNRVWTLHLETTFNGEPVKRKHRMTQGFDWSKEQVEQLIDAVGGDPNKQKVQDAFANNEIKHQHFRNQKFSAMVRHVEQGGRTYDEIDYPIPGFYREQWEAAQRGENKAPAQRQDAITDEEIAESPWGSDEQA